MLSNRITYVTRSTICRFSSNTKRKWKSVVGLEVHAQILSESKLFSPSSSSFMFPPNSTVSFLDSSIPGTLPVLNKRCVEAGIMASLALNCKLNLISMFDRKHYFYGDMPTGYQITQQRNPLAKNGHLKFYVFTPGIHKSPYLKEVDIKQIQLEQDSGRSLHDVDRSLVDLNRAGIGLMEVVFEPNLSDGEEAAALIKELCAILKKIGACSCKMEEGALRVDANVSIHKEGEPLGIRTEIKNISSVRGVASAIKYEIERQIALKEQGLEIVNETRSWNANNKSTEAMRDKEQVQDYRYMPEPNLPPLCLTHTNKETVNIENLRKSLPELPAQMRERFQEKLGLTRDQVVVLVNDEALLHFFETGLTLRKLTPKFLANILIYEFSGVVNKLDVIPGEFLHKDEFLADIVYLLESGQINRDITRYLFEELLQNNPKDPTEIVKERNLFQIMDEQELTEICQSVIDENKNLADLYRTGKNKVYKTLMKEILIKTNQRANMAKCDVIMKNLLNK